MLDGPCIWMLMQGVMAFICNQFYDIVWNLNIFYLKSRIDIVDGCLVDVVSVFQHKHFMECKSDHGIVAYKII